MQTSLLLRDILSTVEIRGLKEAVDVEDDDDEDVDGDAHEDPNEEKEEKNDDDA